MRSHASLTLKIVETERKGQRMVASRGNVDTKLPEEEERERHRERE